MKLAKTMHFDDSDLSVFSPTAPSGEWAVSGGFAFANWPASNLNEHTQAAFENGWLGIGSFGRATHVVVAEIQASEVTEATQALADHMLEKHNAPSPEVAYVAAVHEIEFMQELCEDQDLNSLLAITRELTEDGVKEQYRVMKPK